MVSGQYFQTCIIVRFASLIIEVRSRKIGWPLRKSVDCVISFLSQLELNFVNYNWRWDFEISWQPHVHREVIFQRLVLWHGHVGRNRNLISWKWPFWSGLLRWVWWRYICKEGNPSGSHMLAAAQTDRLCLQKLGTPPHVAQKTRLEHASHFCWVWK